MSYDLMFQKAIELQNNGALNEAESIYLKMLQAMPENSDVWNLLGLVAQSKGNLLRAVDCFLSAIKYSPKPFGMYFFNLALTYKSLNKPREALEGFKRVTELMPDLCEGWNYLGLMHQEDGDINNAVKSYCKALELDGNYMEARANLCYITNDFVTLKKLAKENDTDFMTNYLAGKVSDDLDEKEVFLQNAIKSAPEKSIGYLAMADLLREKNDFCNSLIYYHKALNLDEHLIQALLGVADCNLEIGELEKAENYYIKSFKITRDIAGAHLNYGICLYKQNRLAEALNAYKEAAVLAPETPEISYNTALILREMGDYEEALGLMFNAHLRAPEKEIFAINIMETLSLLFNQNAELALKIAENWQKQEPDNIFSKKLFSSFGGSIDDDLDCSYAKILFDNFAETYDDTIIKLKPRIIHKFKELYGDIKGRVLDLGCGTGLAIEELKNDKNSFVGVDISANMIKMAEQKGGYDELICADIVEYLQKNKVKGEFDLVISFDVFCYLGNLEPVLKLLKGCEVWFSIEKADDDRGDTFYPIPTGRYKHHEKYISHLAQRIGFKEIKAFELVLRKENNEDVNGYLFRLK